MALEHFNLSLNWLIKTFNTKWNWNIQIIYRLSLQISEIHAIFNHPDVNNNAVTVRVYVTNLALKTAECFIDASGGESQENRHKVVVHPQHTTEVLLPLECHGERCEATGECKIKTFSILDISVLYKYQIGIC